MRHKFVDTETELAQSVIEFSGQPDLWKASVGTGPLYFVHIKVGGKHSFGLSKFCAFKNITVGRYISKFRYETYGGVTQKHIARVTGKKWIPRRKINSEIRNAFEKWIIGFYPNYNLDKASFITLSSVNGRITHRKKFIDPKTLEKKLELQKLIGETGEQIAFDYELGRLKANGVKNAAKYIERVSSTNAAAGFDMRSCVGKDERFIEVKSSLNRNLDFFITENEFQTLKDLGDNAYLYFVHIEDRDKKKGKVFRTLKNPIKELIKTESLTPVVYKVEMQKKS